MKPYKLESNISPSNGHIIYKSETGIYGTTEMYQSGTKFKSYVCEMAYIFVIWWFKELQVLQDLAQAGFPQLQDTFHNFAFEFKPSLFSNI